LVEKFGISASRIIPQSKGADDENTKELPKLQDKRTIDRSDPELIDAYNRRVTFVIK
jgi:hypothetical protein